MPAASALLVLLIVLSILGTMGLWYAIDSETAGSETLSRADAERVARQDSTDQRQEEDDRDASDDWGSDAEWGVDEATDRR
ncbi:hypothetical protein [Halolamina salifodinae]|uniref:Uncharacterized protein n=1 Tax=Halolamina salifodinae TaxID=1202767 RepID=A0A8T4GVY1_9EURY|nr:hypothetical protein [Halolamina salifodinae]MBP1987076.1 hypothetical protein [Halolamina salifodinae]